MRTFLTSILFATALAGLAGCAPTHFDPASGRWTHGRSAPLPAPRREWKPAPEKRQRVAEAPLVHASRGRKIFDLYCSNCHPNGAAGAGPALTKPIDPVALKAQIRKGAGAMPAFNAKQIDDDSFDALADFLVSKTHRSIARE